MAGTGNDWPWIGQIYLGGKWQNQNGSGTQNFWAASWVTLWHCNASTDALSFASRHYVFIYMAIVVSKFISDEPHSVNNNLSYESSSMLPNPDAALDYKKMYERVSTMASIGVWEFDLVNNELIWSDVIYDLFEVPRGRPITRAFAMQFYSAESLIEMEALRAQAIASGGSFSIDIEVTTSRETRRWINLSADVEQENGISIRIFGTKQDITDRKRAQDQIKHLQSERVHTASRAAMGSIAATLAHELNQPLAAIVNYAAGTADLLRSVQVPVRAADGLREIKANALRAGDVMRRMRKMIENGRGKTELFDLVAVLKDAVSLACTPSTKVSVNLLFEHSGAVAADRVQVMQVAFNIIRNACEAMVGAEHQEISVTTHDDGKFIIVSIADSGPGLPSTLKLFEPMDSTKAGGMGIGLSICRTIVEGNGGKIWSASAPTGAKFCFNLPKLVTLQSQ